jgi:hypothetical protein
MHIKKVAWPTALCAAMFFSLLTANGQQLATNVSWYFYPCSLPNNVTLEFGTVRDNLLTGIEFGGSLDTGSRVGNPAGIEIRSTFDSTDMTVSSTNHLWRGVFNPPAPYASQYGQRLYCPVLLIGNGGKVCMDDIQYRVACGVALLGNESSLTGLGYSVSRVGILAGPDGILFTDDNTFLNSGESGTNLVDAIAFIGGSIGALINQPSDYNALNAAIGTNGAFVSFEYQFASATNTLTGGTTVWLYPRGGIPNYNTVQFGFFIGPNGVLFSVIGPPGVLPMTINTSRCVRGPWSTATTSATEGTSVFEYFTHNPRDDMGFVCLVVTNSP